MVAAPPVDLQKKMGALYVIETGQVRHCNMVLVSNGYIASRCWTAGPVPSHARKSLEELRHRKQFPARLRSHQRLHRCTSVKPRLVRSGGELCSHAILARAGVQRFPALAYGMASSPAVTDSFHSSGSGRCARELLPSHSHNRQCKRVRGHVCQHCRRVACQPPLSWRNHGRCVCAHVHATECRALARCCGHGGNTHVDVLEYFAVR